MHQINLKRLLTGVALTATTLSFASWYGEQEPLFETGEQRQIWINRIEKTTTQSPWKLSTRTYDDTNIPILTTLLLTGSVLVLLEAKKRNECGIVENSGSNNWQTGSPEKFLDGL